MVRGSLTWFLAGGGTYLYMPPQERILLTSLCGIWAFQVVVLSISPSHTRPSFSKVASCILKHPKIDEMININPVIPLDRTGVIVWDFTTHCFGKLPIKDYLSSRKMDIPMFTGNAFIDFTAEELRLWQAPSLGLGMVRYLGSTIIPVSDQSTPQPLHSHALWDRTGRGSRSFYVFNDQHDHRFFFDTSTNYGRSLERYDVVVDPGSLDVRVSLQAEFNRPCSEAAGQYGVSYEFSPSSQLSPAITVQEAVMMVVKFNTNVPTPIDVQQYAVSIHAAGVEECQELPLRLKARITPMALATRGQTYETYLAHFFFALGHCVYINTIPDSTVSAYDYIW